jgi:hypothetical protein
VRFLLQAAADAIIKMKNSDCPAVTRGEMIEGGARR